MSGCKGLGIGEGDSEVIDKPIKIPDINVSDNLEVSSIMRGESTKDIVIEYTNHTNYEWSPDNSYQLEKLNPDKESWAVVPPKKDIIVEDILRVIKPGKSLEYKVLLGVEYLKLDSGQYRIGRKVVFIEEVTTKEDEQVEWKKGDELVVYSYFEIK